MTTPLDPAYRELGAALAGEFDLESELGRGGMGVVFKARDVMLDRPVALKVLPPRLAEDTDLKQRFLREARTAAQLSHPHIVPIHRADERAGFAFFTMALVDGETLGARVRDRGPLPPGDAVRHLREVAWALAYAHARGVIHRDVKPENILIERGSGRAWVTDFGIARNDHAPGLTSEGHVVGTAHFMSPEQAQALPLDGRSDLYSLGVLGFFLLSGRLPFEGEASAAVLVAHITRPAPRLRDVAPDVPPALAEVIDRCLAKDANHRFATGEALAEALGAALAAAEAAVPPERSGGHSSLSESEAQAVWRRAAQLQAEAASRLERHARDSALRALGGETAGPEALPTRGYRAADVESAAVEAGISQRFVALALSELPTHAGLAPDALAGEDSTRDRLATRILGRVQRSLSVSRVIRAPARDVLRAIGHTFQQVPYRMVLRDQLGPHPLDGGILVFRLPDMDASGQMGFKFTWLRYGLYARDVRATLRPLANEPGACEVTLYADLRSGITANVWGYAGLTVGFAGGSGAAGFALGFAALGLTGAMLAAPIVAAAVAGAAVALGGTRSFYNWEVKKARTEMDEVLEAVEGTLRSRSVFDADPPILPPPRSGDDLSWIAGAAG